jgi:hypothetical protein
VEALRAAERHHHSQRRHDVRGGPKESFEGGGVQYRNVGWKQGVRIGSAKDGTLHMFIEGTNPEGMAADELGNVFAGLTGGCATSKSGGCIQKWVKK